MQNEPVIICLPLYVQVRVSRLHGLYKKLTLLIFIQYYEGLFWLISFIFANIRAELYRQENDATMAIVNYSQVNLYSRPLYFIVYLIFLLY